MYLNPVDVRHFPDPFVLKSAGVYWGYATGRWRDGRCFGILRSRDLQSWEEIGGAMEPLPGDAPCYWAPEVIADEGRFLMYYSVGDEVRMQIRVAVAEHPAGPFVDSGRRLTSEEFAIDPHVFIDHDGTRWLFYAIDFTDHARVGTGTVCDHLLDPFTLAGHPRPVTRAISDWQIYDPCRASKGNVCWHTVEGPFVLERKGIYYQMFSGGNWQNPSYGVSYAVTSDLDAPGEWRQAGEDQRVLRTIPGAVIGPGHNSCVRGPDNRQLFCVYHRWAVDFSHRVMAIDRLDWAGERLIVLGPSYTPQSAPLLPTLSDFFDREHQRGLGHEWDCAPEDGWSTRGGEAIASHALVAEAQRPLPAPHFVSEVSLRPLDQAGGGGVALRSEDEEVFRCLITSRSAQISWLGPAGRKEERLALPAEYEPSAFHLLRIEADVTRVSVQLDDSALRWSGTMRAPARRLALVAAAGAAFAGFALTSGWEHLFDDEAVDLEALDYRVAGGAWEVASGRLRQADSRAEHAAIFKEIELRSYELVINARLGGLGGGSYGFYPALEWPIEGSSDPAGWGPLIRLETADGACHLVARGRSGASSVFPLPREFDPTKDQHFRLWKRDAELTLYWETVELGKVACPATSAGVGLYAHRAEVEFEMVRLTAIS
jgi:GH43 family beta-xylosidase